MSEPKNKSALHEHTASRRSGQRSLFALIAFGFLALVLASGLVLALLYSFRWNFAPALSKHHAFYAQVYREALAEGDAAQAYEMADDRFKAIYDRERLRAFFDEHPYLFEVPTSVSTAHTTLDSETIRSATFSSNDGERAQVFVVDDGERFQLLGIDPELIDAVPDQIRKFDVFDGDFF